MIRKIKNGILIEIQNIEIDEEDSSIPKKMSIWRIILATVIAAVFIFGGMYFLGSF